jgi:hypothetical protein
MTDFISIQKIKNTFVVRYIKSRNIKNHTASTLTEAVEYATNKLKADRDQIITNLYI